MRCWRRTGLQSRYLADLCMREVFRSVMSGFISISIKTSHQGVTFTSISGVRSRDESETEAITAVDSFRTVFSSINDHLLENFYLLSYTYMI